MRMSMGKELGIVLRTARVAKGLKVKDVAAHVGISPSAVSQWEAGTSEPGLGNLQRAAELFESSALQLTKMSSTTHAKMLLQRVEDDDRARNNVTDASSAPEYGSITGLARDIPVLGSAAAGPKGDFRLNGTETDRAIRPPGLANARGIFALYVVNDSMYPAWKPGALFYVNPHRVPSIGDDVVVEVVSEDAGEPGDAFLKRLKSRRGGKVVVEQFNPPAEIEFDHDSVRLYRVIPWEEALGLS